jgi:hypothetical protein
VCSPDLTFINPSHRTISSCVTWNAKSCVAECWSWKLSHIAPCLLLTYKPRFHFLVPFALLSVFVIPPLLATCGCSSTLPKLPPSFSSSFVQFKFRIFQNAFVNCPVHDRISRTLPILLLWQLDGAKMGYDYCGSWSCRNYR